MNPYNFLKFVEQKHPEYKWEDVKKRAISKGYQIPADDNNNPYVDGVRNGEFHKYSSYDDGDGPEDFVSRVTNYKNGLYHGNEIEYYLPGKIKTITPYVNGKMEGTLKDFFENGNISRTQEYKDGKLNGKSVWYTEQYPDKVRFTNEYKDGKMNGEEISYNTETGKVESILTYVDNKRRGPYKYFWKSTGKVRAEGTYGEPDSDTDPNSFKDVGVIKRYYENGQLDTYNDVNKGYLLRYEENGDKKYESLDLGDNRFKSSTFTDGKISATGEYKRIPDDEYQYSTHKSVPDGPMILYKPDGTELVTFMYKDGEVVK
jgi:antitoxin component YwqK of YwqJK toxin-antitoxin module